MTLPDNKAREILMELTNLLQHGWGTLLVARHIQEARTSKRINSSHFYFSITENSCIESSIIALSKIIIPHDDSISIHYLLNYAEQNHNVFSRCNKQTILKTIREHRQQLLAISALIANIKEQRDHTLAHLDKKHITNPSIVHTYPPLNYVEVENTFELILNIINTYLGYLNPSYDFRLHSMDLRIAEDANYLIGLIERDNAKSKRNAG
jgi:hypothetical protein